MAQLAPSSDISAHSALCLEFGFLVHSLYLTVCDEGMDPYRFSTAGYMARRILQTP